MPLLLFGEPRGYAWLGEDRGTLASAANWEIVYSLVSSAALGLHSEIHNAANLHFDDWEWMAPRKEIMKSTVATVWFQNK